MANEHYILKADIISSRKRHGKQLMIEFKQLVGEVSKKYPDSFNSPVTITLGDEFQAVPRSLYDAVQVIIDLEETTLECQFDWNLRYVVHYGSIDTEVNPSRAYEMMGSGLTRAKELLEEVKGAGSRFLFSVEDPKSHLLNKIFYLYDAHVSSWKANDFKLIHQFIRLKDYKMVADELGKDRAHMWRRKQTLGMEEYFTIKELILDICMLS